MFKYLLKRPQGLIFYTQNQESEVQTMTNEEKDKDKNKASDESEKSEKPEEKDGDSDSKTEKKSGDVTESKKSETSTEEPEQTTPEQSEPESPPETPPDTSGTEALRAENIRLKAQIEAYKTGFRSDTLEDAVILAENITKRDGVEISEALQAVAEKYPDWKNTENNSGFKVGAEPPEENKPDESRLDNAFGIRKKKGL